MSGEPPPDPLAALPRALLTLAGACTLSVVIALVAAMLGHETPPLWVLAVPPVAALAWLILRARRAGGRSEA